MRMRHDLGWPAASDRAVRAIMRTALVAGAALAGSILFGLLAGPAHAGPAEDASAEEASAEASAGGLLGLRSHLPDPSALVDEALGTDPPADSAPAGRVTEPVAEPVTEAVTKAAGEPVTQAGTEPVAEVVTEVVTELVTEAPVDAVTQAADEVATAIVDTAESALVEPVAELTAPVPVVGPLVDTVGGSVEQLVEPVGRPVEELVAPVGETVGQLPGIGAPDEPPAFAGPPGPLTPSRSTLSVTGGDPGREPDRGLVALALLPYLGTADLPATALAGASASAWPSAATSLVGSAPDPHPSRPPGPLPAPGGHGAAAGNPNDHGPPVPWASPPAAQPPADLARARLAGDVTGAGLVMSILSPPG